MAGCSWLLGVVILNPGFPSAADLLGPPGFRIQQRPFSVEVVGSDGRSLFSLVDGVEVSTIKGSVPREQSFVVVWSKGQLVSRILADQVLDVSNVQGTTTVTLGDAVNKKPRAELILSRPAAGVFRIQALASDPATNRTRILLTARPDERFYGMGSRFNSSEHKNSIVTQWAREVSTNLPGVGESGRPEGRDTTYYPVPFYLSSSGYGLLLDDTRYSEFDFQKERPDRVSILNFNREASLDIFTGKDPLEIISRQTAQTGRLYRLPPPWVFGTWAASIRSSKEARNVARILRLNHIPVSAIMIEDWWWSDLLMGNLWGLLNFTPQPSWTVNRKAYPDYERLISDLGRLGFRNIGYFHPYISMNSSSLLIPDANWKAGDAAGLFTKNPRGKSYQIPFFVWKVSQLDWTSPAAVSWFADRFFDGAARTYGLNGWMHDFGEYTPSDAIFNDGRNGLELHNLYPLLWAQQAKNFWERARPDGDYVFFTRSGYTGLQRYAPLYFTGDRNATDDPFTGLGGQIPAILGAGISGHPIGTIDIGAYYCEKTAPMGKELFLRWVELGALMPVMRLHRGLYPLCNHWDFSRDTETIAHFKTYSLLHASLFPYFYTLAHGAKQTGWPIIRHLVLHFPHDSQVVNYPYEFLLGDRLLAAPVIRLGRTSQEVCLPNGRWRHWWSGTTYEGPTLVTIPAPIGQVPLFSRAGKIIPIFDAQFDTLVPSYDPNLLGWQSANASIKVLFTGSGKDSLRLWDGTLISCNRYGQGQGRCEVQGGAKRRYSFQFF
ncbi:MAG: hypothetical protein EBS30_10275 [Planctomycetes bacterium]|nr:hypothetical protein [Planctomycetota bacterium]